MTGIWSVVGFLVTICVVVAVHEGGHFWAARRLGILVERFSIGMGPVIWRRRASGKLRTEYALSLLPIGGYVKFVDDDAALAPEERARLYVNAPVWKRALVVAAGPLMNFILAVALFASTGITGVKDIVPYVAPMPGSQAERVGVEPLDLVRSVDGQSVQGALDLNSLLLGRVGDDSVSIVFERSGRQEERVFDLSAVDLDKVANQGGFVFPEIGLGLTGRGAMVVEPVAGGPADRAGLKKGDIIRRIDGRDATLQIVMDTIRESRGRPLSLEVDRVAGDKLSSVRLTMTPELAGPDRWAGRLTLRSTIEFTTVTLGPVDAVRHAVDRVLTLTALQFRSIVGMIEGTVSTEHLSGPVAIADMAGSAAKAGLTSMIEFVAVISVAIGFMNLIPIPALDGGQLVFLGIEAVRGRALSPELQGRIAMIGIAVILMLALFVTMNDIERLAS